MAVADAQNVAESIYAAEDVEQLLEGMGFHSSHGSWTLDRGDYTLYVAGQSAPTEAAIYITRLQTDVTNLMNELYKKGTPQ